MSQIVYRRTVLGFGERDDPWAGTFGRRVPEEVGWYIAGFVDGEGCFSIGTHACSFVIKLRDDDRVLLEWIQSEMGGVGTIRKIAGAGGNQNPQAAFIVSRKAELRWLTELFDTFPLRGKKGRDFLIWRDAVIEWCNGMPVAGLAEYKARLAATRAYPAAEAIEHEVEAA